MLIWKSFKKISKKDVNEAFRLLDRVGLLEMADKELMNCLGDKDNE